MTARRGWLVMPDLKKTDVCDQPGCGDIEGVHLICGCQGRHGSPGRPCQCPGFAQVHRCRFCERPFAQTWQRDAHEGFRTPHCRRVSAERERDAAEKRKRDHYRNKQKATQR